MSRRKGPSVPVYAISMGIVSGSLLVLLLSAQAPPQPLSGPSEKEERRVSADQERVRPNILEGTDKADTLQAGDGDTWILGGEGDDILRGGPGSDAIDGSEGVDRLDGGAGDDVLDGGAGADVLLGGEGDDLMDGGDGEDSLDGGPGSDDLDGGDAMDVLRGGPGEDVVVGGDDNDILLGGDDADRLFGQDGNDTLSGGAGDDELNGGDENDTLDGEAGNDRLSGGEGDDVVRGQAGDDIIDAGPGADLLSGGPGNDILLGSSGADALHGGDDNDTLVGGVGDDVLDGGPGYDWLLGGLGADTIRAGTEDDLIVLRAGDIGANEYELVDGGSGVDILVLNGFADSGPQAPVALGAHGSFLADPLTGGGYHIAAVEQVRYGHLLSSLFPGGGPAASLVFFNPSRSAAATGRAVSFDTEGQALPEAESAYAALSSFEIPPLGRVTLSAPESSSPERGFTQVLADHPLIGLVRTGSGIAGVAGLLDKFIIPVLENPAGGSRTGVAVFSSTVAARIKLTLHQTSGEEVSTPNKGGVEIELPAHGSRLLLVGEVFQELLPPGEKFEGTMTVEGGIDRPQEGGSLAATGFWQASASGSPAAFPVTAVGVTPEARTLYFPGFSAGGGAETSIVLANPSVSERATGTLSFFEEAGQAWPVAVNDLEAAATIPYDIGPLGSAIFRATGTGPQRFGAARAIPSEGFVSGLLHAASPAATAAASRALEAVVAPIQSGGVDGVGVEFAVSSSEGALELEARLRDAQGAEAPGGAATLRLPANGTVVRQLDELFPNADLSDFEGSVSLSSGGGLFAARVTRIGPDANARAQILVTRIKP